MLNLANNLALSFFLLCPLGLLLRKLGNKMTFRSLNLLVLLVNSSIVSDFKCFIGPISFTGGGDDNAGYDPLPV